MFIGGAFDVAAAPHARHERADRDRRAGGLARERVLMLVGGEEIFFEAAAMLVTFVLFGHWMEMKSRRGTSEALRALFDLVPPPATVIRDGREIEIPTARDRRRRHRRPAARRQGAGRRRGASTGETSIDESAGDRRVAAGRRRARATRSSAARSTAAAALPFRATRVGADTALAQIVDAGAAGAELEGAGPAAGRPGGAVSGDPGGRRGRDHLHCLVFLRRRPTSSWR